MFLTQLHDMRAVFEVFYLEVSTRLQIKYSHIT
jgi:hypothetical protein